MKWLRWKGIIAFIIIVGILFILSMLFINEIARSTMENTASRLYGAEVNIGRVDANLSPLGFTIQAVQATNPDNPQTNAIEIEKLAFSVDTLQLFFRKFIVEEMAIQGLTFNTKREKPGRVRTHPKKEDGAKAQKKWELPELPSFSQKDILAILEKEDLKTLDLIQSLQADIQSRKTFWDKRLKEIPGRERFEEYQTRLEKIKNRGSGDVQSILSAGTEVKSLQEDIRKDLGVLKETQGEFNRDFGTINDRMIQVRNAPQEDIRYLVMKYGPSPSGIGNISAFLFGDRIGTWVERCLVWYQRLTPFIQRDKEVHNGKKVTKPLRAEGLDVLFPEYTPLPDFLVRTATASITLDQGTFNGKIHNITPDQDILGSPLSFAFSGEGLKDIKNILLNGSFDRIDPVHTKDQLRLSLKGYTLPPVDLGAQALSVTLEGGRANVDLSTTSFNEKIIADVITAVSSARFLMQESEKTSMVYASVASALSRIRDFTLKAHFAGTPEEYAVEIQSDLEKALKQAFENLAADLSSQFEQQARKAVQEKIASPMDALGTEMNSMNAIKNELTARIDSGNSLLKDMSIPSSKKGGLKLPIQ